MHHSHAGIDKSCIVKLLTLMKVLLKAHGLAACVVRQCSLMPIMLLNRYALQQRFRCLELGTHTCAFQLQCSLQLSNVADVRVFYRYSFYDHVACTRLLSLDRLVWATLENRSSSDSGLVVASAVLVKKVTSLQPTNNLSLHIAEAVCPRHCSSNSIMFDEHSKCCGIVSTSYKRICLYLAPLALPHEFKTSSTKQQLQCCLTVVQRQPRCALMLQQKAHSI